MQANSLSSCLSVSPSSRLFESWSWDASMSMSGGGCSELRSLSMIICSHHLTGNKAELKVMYLYH
jgi:hypothetical protein